MFGRVFGAGAAKAVAGCVSVQLSAAAVALSDKELKRKPYWYRQQVLELEHSIRKLSTYSFIESGETLQRAAEALEQVKDVENAEILWRLARVYAEQAELCSCPKRKHHLLEEATRIAWRAICLCPDSAPINKWYAIALCRRLQVEKMDKKTLQAREMDVQRHLEKATKLDDKDPFTWHLLGRHKFHQKEYQEALKCFQKAESIRADYSPMNLFYLGETQRLLGQKKEATDTLKHALTVRDRLEMDGKGRSEAKRVLVTYLKQKPEELEPPSEW